MLVRIEMLASQVAAHAGVSSPLADYALRAIVAGIGGYLAPNVRQVIAEELPEPLALALNSAPHERRSIEERVQLTGMTRSQTLELVASVCRVLADHLSTDANNTLMNALPPSVGALLVPSSPSPPHPVTHHRQPSSVAEPNPHAETKLSSAPGTTQDRELETLATWRGTRHRLSDPN